MPSAATCDTTPDSSKNISPNNKNNNNDSPKNGSNQESNGSSKDSNKSIDVAAGFIDDDVDYEIPVKKVLASDAAVAKNDNEALSSQNDDTGKPAGEDEQGDDFIFIQDTGFNIKIAAPGMESFELQVNTILYNLCL